MPKNIKHELCEIGKILAQKNNIFDKWIEKSETWDGVVWRRKVSKKDSIIFFFCLQCDFEFLFLSICIFIHTQE